MKRVAEAMQRSPFRGAAQSQSAGAVRSALSAACSRNQQPGASRLSTIASMG